MIRVPHAGLAVGPLELDAAASRYAARVRRVQAGDVVLLFDPEAAVEAEAVVEQARGKRGEVRVVVGAVRPASLRPRRAVTVIQCVGKADKLDQVVRDATELGATAVLPAWSERCVAERSSLASLARLGRVAVEAARQCLRGDVPRVEAPRPLSEVLAETKSDVRMVLDPTASRPLRAALEGAASTTSVAFVVGPEGGLSSGEILACAEAGFGPVRLGGLVLRTETAATAALGAIAALLDDEGVHLQPQR